MDTYEKRYKEALEKARKLCGYPTSKPFVSDLQDLFPELKENKDERVKEAIIATIHLYYGEPLEDEAKEMISWLEKQGTPAKLSEKEQNRFAKGVLTSCALSFIDYLDAHKYEGKMCVSNGECEDIENAFHNAMWDRLHRYYCKYIEKQGQVKESTLPQQEEKTCEENDNSLTSEQRVEEAMRELEEKSIAYMEAHKWESADEFMAMCRGEQKPINDTNEEISEELKAASILHSELVRNQSCIDEDFIAGAQWLKRQNCAWSEEDKKRVERIYRRIWAYRKGDTDEIYQIEQDANWLKSLKDRLK